MKVYKMYADLRVKDLPATLKQGLLKGFDGFEEKEILEATIQSWKDFLFDSQLQTGAETQEFWERLFADAVVVDEVRPDIFILGLKILDFLDTRWSYHQSFDNIALVDWGMPALIYDADLPYFGEGYIVIGKSKDGEFYFIQDLATQEQILKNIQNL
jgi:hypothetical protein